MAIWYIVKCGITCLYHYSQYDDFESEGILFLWRTLLVFQSLYQIFSLSPNTQFLKTFKILVFFLISLLKTFSSCILIEFGKIFCTPHCSQNHKKRKAKILLWLNCKTLYTSVIVLIFFYICPNFWTNFTRKWVYLSAQVWSLISSHRMFYRTI